jgi:hypothetical protein
MQASSMQASSAQARSARPISVQAIGAPARSEHAFEEQGCGLLRRMSAESTRSGVAAQGTVEFPRISQ